MEGFTQDDFDPNYSFNNTNVSTDSYDINVESNLSENSDSVNNSDNDKLIYSCPICREKYNKNSRCAHVIFPCGHSFCKQCINKINLCAICRKPIENVAVNWSLQSKILDDSYDVDFEIINPIYHVFIKLKDKIEEMYIKYPNNDISSESSLSDEQKILINEVLVGLRNSKSSEIEIDINHLLIPEWLKNGINNKIDNILDYKTTVDRDLINFLPFCP